MYVEWVTAKRETIPVGIMTNAHLRHTIVMLKQGRGPSFYPYHGFSRHEWLLILGSELIKRSRVTTK